MSNRRMIDSRMRSSENFASLSYRQRDLWHGLIVSADDQGRTLASPAYVRSVVWPYDDISLQDVEDDLKAIEAIGSLLIYKVDGKKYLQLVNWWKYQQGQWASASDHPAPDGWVDRVRCHGKGNELIVLNWQHTGGFNSIPEQEQDSKQDSNLDSLPDSTREEDDVEDDDDVEGEEERNLAAPPPKPPRTAENYKKSLAEAMQRGFKNHMTLQAKVEKRFCITPKWQTKTARAFTAWLKERPENETVEAFGDWWYSDDWRGKNGQPPTLTQIQELWPQAFKDGNEHRKDYTSGEFADIINRDPDERQKIRDDFQKSIEATNKEREKLRQRQ